MLLRCRRSKCNRSHLLRRRRRVAALAGEDPTYQRLGFAVFAAGRCAALNVTGGQSSYGQRVLVVAAREVLEQKLQVAAYFALKRRSGQDKVYRIGESNIDRAEIPIRILSQRNPPFRDRTTLRRSRVIWTHRVSSNTVACVTASRRFVKQHEDVCSVEYE